ncbi:MAG: hypothetical protein ACI3ZR_06165 [bacterium]
MKKIIPVTLLLTLFILAAFAFPCLAAQNPMIKNISFHNAEIKDILYLLSKNTGVNIILAEDTVNDSKNTPRLTMNLKHIPLYSALDLITAAAGLNYTNVGNNILVGKSQVIGKNFHTAVAERIKLNYADAFKMKDTLVALGVVDFDNIFVYGEQIKDEKKSTVEKDLVTGVKKITSYNKDDDDEGNKVESLKATGLTETRFDDFDKASSLSANVLVIRDTPDNLKKIKEIIASLDQPAAKIMVEAKVIEINESGLKELGIDWMNNTESGGKSIIVDKIRFSENKRPSGQLGVGSFNRNTLNFAGTIKALVEKGNAKVLSSPKISTLDGKPAFIYVGDKIPYITSREINNDNNTVTTEVAFLSAGITLEILPIITDNNEIQLKIYSEVSSIKEYDEVGGISYPVPSMRQAQTMTRVQDGETIIIGGLIYESEQKSMSKIPLLGDIPILKSLFSWTSTSKDKKEVIISLTPHQLN